MTLVNLASVAGIITMLIAVISVYPLFKSLRQYERNLRFQVYKDVLTMLECVREERYLLEDKTTADPEFDVLKLDEEGRKPFYELARAYDKLGLLIKHGVVPLEFVLDYYSKPIVSAWKYLEPFVQEVRRQKRRPGYWKKFQRLAMQAKEYRKRIYPQEQTFEVSPEDRAEWKTWRK